MDANITYEWRGTISDLELVELVESHGGRPEAGWWDRVRPHSLGWVVGRLPDQVVAGFVNVAWDGGDHAFLVDTKVRGSMQHRGIGTVLVEMAATQSRTAGCEWLHVDWEERLTHFYVGGCGFRPTAAGLIHLRE